MEEKIERHKENLIRNGLSEREFSTLRDLAIKNLQKILYTYSESKGDLFRANIFDFLLSRGNSLFEFDLYLANSFSRIEKNEIPSIFYTLTLNKDVYYRWFGDNSLELANSIPFRAEVEPYRIIQQKGKRVSPIKVYPDTYFNSFQGRDAIIKIAEFLKGIANEYGKIRSDF